ncbi:cytochrome-c peroxidase [Paraburkholderia sp. MM5384-R2]|uniref:cytochrome-c peroxidase n=1 Tax=Paraburkholderia sp. MM5384-R2 TaxID=2723097 RepID=UPI001C860CD9|nr:cytochrome c peroxidase [Paraburkholderia sp. MM5384-R2]
MNRRSNATLSSQLPTASAPSPRAASSTRRRLILRIVLGIVLLGVALVGYALIYPERMPAAIGDTVENLTGLNAHPVKLLRPPVAPLSAVAVLGRDLFNDPSLSASGKQSCASCHSAAHAFSPPNDLTVQPGGLHMTEAGYRPVPSLAYLYRQAPFSIGPDQGDTDAAPVSLDTQASAALGVQRAQKTAGVAPAAPAMVPQGGLFWDGRASTLQDQALGPLTNPVEMANPDLASVADKLRHSKHIDTLRQLFGPHVVNDPDLLVSEAMFAIGRYEFEDPAFHPFSSKYDAWLEGRARLTQAELRGLRLFNDKDKANCAGCHLSQPTSDGLPPLFTDTQYEALGVPRNRELAPNRNPKFYDMGICGPFRTDMARQTQYCGMFLTPTLRNAAERKTFFHNGVYHDLKQVLDFYNLRNTSPDRIYPRDASGKVQKYDDLPPQYHANVDVADAPFDRKFGDQPAMTDQDIQDIIAFMKTLSDGYKD